MMYRMILCVFGVSICVTSICRLSGEQSITNYNPSGMDYLFCMADRSNIPIHMGCEQYLNHICSTSDKNKSIIDSNLCEVRLTLYSLMNRAHSASVIFLVQALVSGIIVCLILINLIFMLIVVYHKKNNHNDINQDEPSTYTNNDPTA